MYLYLVTATEARLSLFVLASVSGDCWLGHAVWIAQVRNSQLQLGSPDLGVMSTG